MSQNTLPSLVSGIYLPCHREVLWRAATEGLTNLTKPSPCGVHTRRVVSDENKQHETCNVRASGESSWPSARFGSVRSLARSPREFRAMHIRSPRLASARPTARGATTNHKRSLHREKKREKEGERAGLLEFRGRGRTHALPENFPPAAAAVSTMRFFSVRITHNTRPHFPPISQPERERERDLRPRDANSLALNSTVDPAERARVPRL